METRRQLLVFPLFGNGKLRQLFQELAAKKSVDILSRPRTMAQAGVKILSNPSTKFFSGNAGNYWVSSFSQNWVSLGFPVFYISSMFRDWNFLVIMV